MELIVILGLSAFTHAQRGEPDQAFHDLNEADAVLNSINPEEQSAKNAIAPMQASLTAARSTILWEAGRVVEAIPSLEKAYALLPQFRPVLELLRDLFRAECSLGPEPNPRRALAAVPLADSINPGSVPGFSNVMYAKIYSIAASAAAAESDREALETRAVFRLEKARESGYFRDSRRLRRIEADPAYKRLFARRDYQSFRATIQLGPNDP